MSTETETEPTDEELRIWIAEKCGWSDIGREIVGVVGLPPVFHDFNDFTQIPDYPNDLNAMHEAEKALKADDHHAYACYAGDLVEEFGCDAISITAERRARAFYAVTK